jgi:hypothetical protein
VKKGEGDFERGWGGLWIVVAITERKESIGLLNLTLV